MAIDIHFRDTSLIPIWSKVQRGDRLTFDDGLTMYKTPDLISLGKMAHYAPQLKSGDAVYFVLNQKVDHTNICVLCCKFCVFATKKNRRSPPSVLMSHTWCAAILYEQCWNDDHVQGR